MSERSKRIRILGAHYSRYDDSMDSKVYGVSCKTYGITLVPNALRILKVNGLSPPPNFALKDRKPDIRKQNHRHSFRANDEQEGRLQQAYERSTYSTWQDFLLSSMLEHISNTAHDCESQAV